MALVVLVQWRQRALRQAAQPNANNQNNNTFNQNQHGGQTGNANAPAARRQDENRGLFPRPDDPEFAAWVAGGVGH